MGECSINGVCVYNRTVQPHTLTHIHFARLHAARLNTNTCTNCCCALHENRKLLRMHNMTRTCRAKETDDGCTERVSVRHNSSSNPHAYYYVSCSLLSFVDESTHLCTILFWGFSRRFGRIFAHLKRLRATSDWELTGTELNGLVCVCDEIFFGDKELQQNV